MSENTNASPGLEYNIDIVFCIDITRRMSSLLREIVRQLDTLVERLLNRMECKSSSPHQIRVRIIAFGDRNTYNHPIVASSFFVVFPDLQKSDLHSFVSKLRADGGGKGPNPGLDALAIAMASDWVQQGDRLRHIIVMFTDASAHRLEDRVGEIPPIFRGHIPMSLDQMTDAWEGGGQSASGVATRLKQPARRLILFAPDTYPWATIGDNWAQTVFLPSMLGDGLVDLDFEILIEILANSV